MKRLLGTLCLAFALVAPCAGQAVFVPPPVTQKTTVQRTAQAWPRGVLVFDTDLSTFFVGDGSTTGGVTTTVAAIPESKVTNLVADLALKAALVSPAFSGTPTAPTATPGTNTTQLATTAYVLANSSSGLTIGSTPVSGGTAGRVPYEGAGPVVSDDAGLTYQTNHLHVGNRGSGTVLTLDQLNGGFAKYIDFTYDAESGSYGSIQQRSGSVWWLGFPFVFGQHVGMGADGTGFLPASGTFLHIKSGSEIPLRLEPDNIAGIKWITFAATGASDYGEISGAAYAMNFVGAYNFQMTPASIGGVQIGYNAGNQTTPGKLGVQSGSAAQSALVLLGSGSQSADLLQVQDNTGSPLSRIYAGGAFGPPHLADASAPVDSLYYSTTAGKLVYKDSGGTVNPLY